MCSELTLSSSQGYFRRSDNTFDGPRLLGISIFAGVPVGSRRQMFFMHDKVAVYFSLAHKNI